MMRSSTNTKSLLLRAAKRIVTTLVLVALLCLLLQQTAMACPNCKEALLHDDSAHAGVARGYYWSILFMMSTPFVLLGGLSSYFYWEVRKAKYRQQRDLTTDS